ncbi:hypothetical protein TELCIR_10885 [Teladorsagia circumcincta]|uniref:Uncharacterized protein n=1 Tax=Teladorsagia circumcincta TaxID=45464 RepID=A0A2G9UAU4_TELCI|nr:hypothetical protein TELCIR_10885 [Teladorsagia circumcincta]
MHWYSSLFPCLVDQKCEFKFHLEGLYMTSEWHEHSFFLEVKPRAELASLFVDCPPEYAKAGGEAGDENDKE